MALTERAGLASAVSPEVLWTDVPFLDPLTAADREELGRVLSKTLHHQPDD
jgi:hypothetical protein